MKDRSLFHLLLARLRKVTEGHATSEKAFARDLQDTLTVTQDGDWFSISWSWQGKSYDLNVAGDTFHFYIRGDIGKGPARHGTRRENWEQAESLLRRIAQISGASLSADREPGTLGILTFNDARGATPHVLLISLALAAGLAAWLVAGPVSALWTAIVAAALCYLNNFESGAISQTPRWFGALLVAAGAVLPSILGLDLSGVALLATALALQMRAEYGGRRANLVNWAVAGAMSGSIVWGLGPAGWIPVAVMAVSALAVHIALPNRLELHPALLFVILALLTAALAMVVPVPAPAQTPMPQIATSGWLVWPVAIVFTFHLLLGWVFGHRFVVFPWLGSGVIAATIVAVYFYPTSALPASFVALLGYGLCLIVRLLRDVVQVRTGARRYAEATQ